MKEYQEKWLDNVLNSLEGSQRAKPKASLLTKVEQNLAHTKVVPLFRLRIAAAAAILLFLVNGFLVLQNINSQDFKAVEQSDEQPLISNYQLYEEWTD